MTLLVNTTVVSEVDNKFRPNFRAISAISCMGRVWRREVSALQIKDQAEEAGIDACAASHFEDGRSGCVSGAGLEQAEHLGGGLVLYAGFTVVGAASAGEAFGYQLLFHRSSK